jgi:hypothetical protein
VVVDSLGRLEPGSPSVHRTNVPAVASNLVREMIREVAHLLASSSLGLAANVTGGVAVLGRNT